MALREGKNRRAVETLGTAAREMSGGVGLAIDSELWSRRIRWRRSPGRLRKRKRRIEASYRPWSGAGEKRRTPNDPKLSDCGGWRAGCMVAERRRQEAASVTAGAVRCSAWLGHLECLCRAIHATYAVE